ncbi:MAG: DUF4382 domain-containing protein [Kangiellaceae bacterium]|nr:DUF4382 domain-containing protein [Kangiellaceae bacterium]
MVLLIASSCCFQFYRAQAKTIDLLVLQNGESAPLSQNESIEAGNYNWLRILVDGDEGEIDSYITLDNGDQFFLYISTGSQMGLKIY